MARGDGQLIIYRDQAPSRGLGRGGIPRVSGWATLAVVLVGVLLVLNGLLGLLLGSLFKSYAAAGGIALDGVFLAQVALGLGLVMRKELARRVYLVFAIAALVLTALHGASSPSRLVDVAVGVATVALLLHPDVRRAFD